MSSSSMRTDDTPPDQNVNTSDADATADEIVAELQTIDPSPLEAGVAAGTQDLDPAAGTVFDGVVKTPEKKPKRQSYTNAQKAALRARARTEPKPTQIQLAAWFLQEYGIRINQSSLSLALLDSRTDLDTEEAANSQMRKQKPSQFPQLEALLSQEQRQLEEQGVHVTSTMLKQAGKRLWSEMDVYHDKPMPAFSNGWLSGFKSRHAVPDRGKKRKADEAASPAIVSPLASTTAPSGSAQPTMPSFPTRHPPFSYHPRPAYQAKPGSILNVDRSLYTRIAATASSGARVLTTKHLVPPRSGYAWSVPAGHIVRITTPRGPQVGDLNVWNLHNPRERFWAARTRQLHASHVSLYDRLWSCLPYLRPLITITGDSLTGYGVDARGGRCHDLLGTRCDPYVRKMLTRSGADSPGEEFDFHCHSNLTRAVLPWGLTEADVHDVLNVFQVTGLDLDGRYFMAPSPAIGGSSVHDDVAQREGWTDNAGDASHARASSAEQSHDQAGSRPPTEADYIEFFAEIDILCALSACPGGDLSSWEWGDEDAMRRTCRPLGVEVYKIVEGESAEVLRGWRSPPANDYAGRHGMSIPRGETDP